MSSTRPVSVDNSPVVANVAASFSANFSDVPLFILMSAMREVVLHERKRLLFSREGTAKPLTVASSMAWMGLWLVPFQRM